MSNIDNLRMACAMGSPRVSVSTEELKLLLDVVDAARKLDNWSGDMYEFEYDIIRDAVAALEGESK